MFWRILALSSLLLITAVTFLGTYSASLLRGLHRDRALERLVLQQRWCAGRFRESLASAGWTGEGPLPDGVVKQVAVATPAHLVVYDLTGAELRGSEREALLSGLPDDVSQLGTSSDPLAGTGRGQFTDGTVWLLSPLDIDGRVFGYLFLHEPGTELAQALDELRWWCFCLIGCGVAVAGAASWLLSHRLRRRLWRTRAAVEAMGLGDFAHPIDDRFAGDTLASLNRELATMRATVHQRFEDSERARGDLQRILEAIPEAVVVMDLEQTVLFTNPSFFRMLDVRPRDVRGLKFWSLQRYPGLQRAVDQTFDRHGPVHCEFTTRAPDRVLSFRGRPLTVEGKPGIIVVLQDLTELRRLERLRQDFVANVSHELKTPLTAIRGYAETLLELGEAGAEEQGPVGTAVRFLQRIRDQADRLHALVLDMLRLARVESQEDAFEIRPLDLSACVEECVEGFREAAVGKELRLVAEVAPDAGAVMGDAEGVRIVLGNLLENAIQYTPAGGLIELTASRESEERVRIDVRDTGCGIAAKHLPRLFERFYRIDASRSRELGGTGLGLAIVKHVTQALGGSVEVRSRVGVGSTFSVHLPTAPAPSLVDTAPTATSRTA